jgi:transitional endoplasmic reticulum ATPase
MQLSLKEDPIELEGTQKVMIQTDTICLNRQDDTSAPHFVILTKDTRSCGAIVEHIESGDHTISMDKYLRIYLQARTGDAIEAEFSTFPIAESVALLAPAEYVQNGLKNLVRDSLIGKPLSPGQPVPLLVVPLTGEDLVGEVITVQPQGIAVVNAETNLEFQAGKVSKAGVTYDSIGGLAREIEKIREIVEYPFRYPEVFQQLGIVPPRGIILYGSPGTGKTLITKALAHEIGASVFTIQGPEIISGWYGGSEQNLRYVFDQARTKTPAIILIDELDSIAPRRDRTQGEVEHRVVATLLTLMDGLSELKDLVVIGTTNTVNSIDPALRRPGRFEHEIHIGVPDIQGRREILGIHTRRMPLDEDVNLDLIAEKAYGFVGADIASLCRQTAYSALKEAYQGKIMDVEEINDVTSLKVTHQDFENALVNIKPSATREVMVEIPQDVSWDSIGGLDNVKQLLIENVIYGIQRRGAFLAAGIKPAKGILLHGPPGTGKTLLAKVLAKEAGANFIAIRGPEIHSKWFGESEEKVRFIFSKAREVAPCIILFDEIDAIAPLRGRQATGLTDSIVNQILAEMDGIEKSDNIFVIGTTNKSDLMDPALLRPGRFDYQIFVPLPDEKARTSIFSVHLKNKPDSTEVSIDEISALTEGFSGADIAAVCRLATLDALRENDFNPENVRLDTDRVKKAIDDLKQTQTQLAEKGF